MLSVHCLEEHTNKYHSERKRKNVLTLSLSATLQERIKGPTASICADGKMSGPSAQHEARGGGEEGRRHSLAVGTAAPVPTATVGLDATLGTSKSSSSTYPRRRHKFLPGGPNRYSR
jgi:hypothetical protein